MRSLAIPYGETRSYKEQAQRLGNPKAVRAVAAANGQNKVSILIPCHRVIGSDGKLTGYAGGLNRKQSLLALERGEVQTTLFDFEVGRIWYRHAIEMIGFENPN